MSVAIEAIAFNHDPGSATGDALNLRRSATEVIRVPEWQRGISVRPEDSPAAYSLSDVRGQTITIQASFRRTDPTPHRIEIRAVEDADDPDVPLECRNVLGDVRARTITFPAGGVTGMETFELEHVRLEDWGVGVRTTTWHWQHRHDHEEWRRFATTRHRIYSLLAIPTSPWQQTPFTAANTQLPWTDVLDHACWWAFGAKTADQAAAMVTRAVYDLGPAVVTYDCPGGGSSHYSWPGFDCTAFLDRLNGGTGNGVYVNCSDCATFVSTFANALGCDLWQSRMGFGFQLNPILAIGSSTWQTACGWGSFNYHEVAWENACTAADDVYDGCLEVNGGADPTQPPYVPLLPVDLRFGQPGDGTYRDRLASPAGRPNCNPQPGGRQRRPVS